MSKLIPLKCVSCSAPLKMARDSTAKCTHCGTDHIMIQNGDEKAGMVPVSYFPTPDSVGKTVIPLKLQIIKFLRAKHPEYYIADVELSKPSLEDRLNEEITLVSGVPVIEYIYYVNDDADLIYVQEIGIGKGDRYKVVGKSIFGDRYDWVLCDVPEASAVVDIKVEDVINKELVVGQRIVINVADEEHISFADTLVEEIYEKFGVLPDSYLAKL